MFDFIAKNRFPVKLLYLMCIATAAGAAAAANVATDADRGIEKPGDEAEITITLGAQYSNNNFASGPRLKPEWSPLLDLEYKRGRFYASIGRGIGFGLVQDGVFTVGTGVSFRPGRKARDNPRLRGMGDVPSTGLVVLDAGWGLLDGLIQLNGTASLATKRSIGSFYSLGTSVGFPIWGQLNGFVQLSTTLADKNYTQTIYGVTPAQAVSSGHAVFKPKAGLISTDVSLGLAYEVSKSWSLGASIGQTQLRGDAAKSPLISRRNELSAGLFTSYTF